MLETMVPEIQHLAEELQPQLTETVLRKDEPLAKKTTLRVGGLADHFTPNPPQKRIWPTSFNFAATVNSP